MDYGTAVITALLTFITPCVLPLLPVYVSYFTAGESGRMKTLFKVLAFCAGISIFFIILFATAISVGVAFSRFLDLYRHQINVVCGTILILMGLKFMGYLNLPFLDKTVKFKANTDGVNILDAFIMGLVFSLSLGTCALGFIMTAMAPIFGGATVMKGILISVLYIGTLNLLFIICAMLIDQLKGMFSFIKRHYRVINLVSGSLLLVLGIMISMGFMEQLTGLLA